MSRSDYHQAAHLLCFSSLIAHESATGAEDEAADAANIAMCWSKYACKTS
jgi:hypothetical protein